MNCVKPEGRKLSITMDAQSQSSRGIDFDDDPERVADMYEFQLKQVNTRIDTFEIELYTTKKVSQY
jgi:hypothetical protein